jgi:hypothetical protein
MPANCQPPGSSTHVWPTRTVNAMSCPRQIERLRWTQGKRHDRRDVLEILGLLRQAGADVWIGGGWGIDALVGCQTRDHRDLDLMHRQEQEPAVVAVLTDAGFAETLDRRPVRSVVADTQDREIDLHPLAFAPDGHATQATTWPSSAGSSRSRRTSEPAPRGAGSRRTVVGWRRGGLQ